MAHSALPRGHRKVFPSSFAMSKWELCLGPQYTHSCGNRKSSQQTVSACITMPEWAHMSAISLLSLRLRVGSAERKGQFAALMPSEAGAHSYGTDSIPTRSLNTERAQSHPSDLPPDVACSLLQWVAGIRGSGEAIWCFPKTRKLAARADKRSAGDISESAEAEASDAGVVTIDTRSCSPYRRQPRTLEEMVM